MVALVAQLLKYANCVGNAGFERVIGVHQKCTGIRVEISIGSEGSILIREDHDPAVRMRPHDGYVKHLTGQYIGGANTAADPSSSGSLDSCIRTLGPAKTELHNPVTLSGVHNAGSLGGDQRLMIDHI